MKNAVWYRNCWLMPNSQAYFLHELYKKFGTKEDRKKLDDHMKAVEKVYNEHRGVSV